MNENIRVPPPPPPPEYKPQPMTEHDTLLQCPYNAGYRAQEIHCHNYAP